MANHHISPLQGDSVFFRRICVICFHLVEVPNTKIASLGIKTTSKEEQDLYGRASFP